MGRFAVVVPESCVDRYGVVCRFYSISDVRLLLICDDWSRTESSHRRAVLRDGGG